MSPRLAYLVSRYPAVSHTFVLREVRRLRELGFTIDVASINRPDRPLRALTPTERDEAEGTFYVKSAGLGALLGAHVATLLSRPASYLGGLCHALRRGGLDPRRLLWALFYFGEAVLVGRWMRRRGARHLHVHFANPASTVASIAARIFPISYSLTVHGSPPFHDEPGLWFAETAAGARFIFCISRFCRAQVMLRTDPSRWSTFDVLRMGVDPERFAPRPREPRSGTFEILCVARLTPVKGLPVLLEAVHRLASEGRDVRLRVVGDGPERPRLEQQVARLDLGSRVVFEGAVDQDRIRDLYAAADAFALASFTEGVPVVLMEAMAMEIPCVATAIAGIPELIRPLESGLLVPPSDAPALAAALARLMDDPELAARLARHGRRDVLEHYDLARNTKALAEAFRRRLELPPA